MDGRYVRLEPLDSKRQSCSRWSETNGPGVEAQWQYLFDEPCPDEQSFFEYMTRKAETKDPLYYAIVDKSTGKAVGY